MMPMVSTKSDTQISIIEPCLRCRKRKILLGALRLEDVPIRESVKLLLQSNRRKTESARTPQISAESPLIESPLLSKRKLHRLSNRDIFKSQRTRRIFLFRQRRQGSMMEICVSLFVETLASCASRCK